MPHIIIYNINPRGVLGGVLGGVHSHISDPRGGRGGGGILSAVGSLSSESRLQVFHHPPNKFINQILTKKRGQGHTETKKELKSYLSIEKCTTYLLSLS